MAVEAKAALEGQQSGIAAPALAQRPRVLLVDDDERNLLAIGTVLEDLAEVVSARSGEEALRHLLGGEFAVILLDVFMPGMDGYETAQIIRGRDQTKRIPIVFLSAVNKEAEHLIRGYSMGAVDYVFKPVESIVLRSKVSVFVDLFEKGREIERKARHEQALLDENLRANAERLRIEQELRRAEQRQAAIIQSLPIVFYVEEDAMPRLPSFVGGNFESVTGFRFDEVKADPGVWTDRLHPDDRRRVLKALADRKRDGAMAIEYRWRCANGEYKHFLDQAVMLQEVEPGAKAQFAGTLLDISDRKELETQLLQARKMDAIGKLTGGIAHDFNNLLAAVMGGLGLIERRVPLDDSQKKIIGMTRHAAEQGAELVGRLLAFARRQQLEPAPVDMGQLATAVSDLLAPTLGGLVQLRWDVPEGIGCAYADGSQLELAIMNLIINARDAMPEGGTVTGSAEARTLGPDDQPDLPPGDYIAVAIEDEGCGIPPELLEQVMEPFFTTKDVGKGTGLGLSMVYGFVRQSGGTVVIESTVGRGTRVELWLPAARDGGREAPAMSNEPHEIARGEPLRILLVDDHHAVRATTVELLLDLGHHVEAVEDGPAMLERLLESPDEFDLIVTDYAMPQMSGSDAIAKARVIRPGLPGIIISGYADAEAITHKPADVAVLRKPFVESELARAIAAVTAGERISQAQSTDPATLAPEPSL